MVAKRQRRLTTMVCFDNSSTVSINNQCIIRNCVESHPRIWVLVVGAIPCGRPDFWKSGRPDFGKTVDMIFEKTVALILVVSGNARI